MSAERKVGCDRVLPNCINCQKGQRLCQGYGLRLAWPDKQDGRRKQKRYEVRNQGFLDKYVKQEDGSLVFLNTTSEDISGSKSAIQDLVKYETIGAMSTTIPKSIDFLQICEQDGMLLNHCTAHECNLAERCN